MPALAFKAYEIEEFVDIHFFRRVGIVIAYAARGIGFSPNAVSVVSGLVGGVGGALLATDRFVWLGVALIVAHGAFDSADGQLARMTGQVSELGRLLDGLGGYVTHAAAYIAIALRVVWGGGSWWVVGVGLLAGAATALHAQMYDYHRTAYSAIVLKGRTAMAEPWSDSGADRRSGLVRGYEALQRRLSGLHASVERAIANRAVGGVVQQADRSRYRECFYRPVRCWNLFGDNVRRLGFIALASVHHLEWYFAFILIPLNVLLIGVWTYQQRADQRFLDGSSALRQDPPQRAVER